MNFNLKFFASSVLISILISACGSGEEKASLCREKDSAIADTATIISKVATRTATESDLKAGREATDKLQIVVQKLTDKGYKCN